MVIPAGSRNSWETLVMTSMMFAEVPPPSTRESRASSCLWDERVRSPHGGDDIEDPLRGCCRVLLVGD
jgi:hypothetical protein